MSAMSISLGGGNYLSTGDVSTGIHFADGSRNDFDLDMLGDLTEWIAAAWENVDGSPYEHREYDKGLVAVVKAGEHVIPKRHLDPNVSLERDCE